MMQHQPPPPPTKKPRACVPCHERKVRCDLVDAGTPCTRCSTKDRTAECVVVARPEPSTTSKRKRAAANAESTQGLGRVQKQAADEVSSVSTASRTPTSRESAARHTTADNVNVASPFVPGLASPPSADASPAQSPPNRRPNSSSSASQGPHQLEPSGVQYSMTEEDGPLQTLCRMSDNEAVILSPASTGKAEQPTRRIFEYYSDYNALTVLNDAIGQQNRCRLVQIDLDEPQATSLIQRELCRLDEVDRAYLAQRRVHDLPPSSCCDSMLQLFFRYVYPYTPVVDRVQLAYDHSQRTCSTFLLYAIFAITVPYASADLLQAMSFEGITEAQRTFFTRARLLYDFGCERSQLNLLQGSIFMSSFQNSFAPDKDFRFWFTNATHMATQMGLHRCNIELDLDPAIHRVCRRIWWLLFQRDVMFCLAGFENVRHINDDEVDTKLLCEDDWVEMEGYDRVRATLPVISKIEVQFMIENCKLTQLGARCLKLVRSTQDNTPSMNEARQIGDDIISWRRALPPELRLENALELDEGNIWVTVILTFSYRLECLFYRALRRRASASDSNGLALSSQRLVGAMFELSTMLRRAMAHDVLPAGPPSMIVCTTQLMALQIEMALDNGCTNAKKQALKAEIHIILSYFKDIEHKWMNAKWASRVFGWAVRHTGLLLGGPSLFSNPGDYHGNPGRGGQQQFQPSHYFDLTQGQALEMAEPMEAFPDNWLQDMIDQGVLGVQDQAMFEILGAPF